MLSSQTNFHVDGHQWRTWSLSSSPRALLASSLEISCIWGRGITAGSWYLSCRGGDAVRISSREASSISASSGVLTWDDVSTGWGKSSSLVGRGVTRTIGSSLFGVEFPDACPDVSNPAQDRSSLTSMAMLTSPSTFGSGAPMGLAIRMEEEWLLGGGTLSFGPFCDGLWDVHS